MSSDLSGRPLGAWYGGIYVGEVDGGVYILIIIRPMLETVYNPENARDSIQSRQYTILLLTRKASIENHDAIQRFLCYFYYWVSKQLVCAIFVCSLTLWLLLVIDQGFFLLLNPKQSYLKDVVCRF